MALLFRDRQETQPPCPLSLVDKTPLSFPSILDLCARPHTRRALISETFVFSPFPVLLSCCHATPSRFADWHFPGTSTPPHETSVGGHILQSVAFQEAQRTL